MKTIASIKSVVPRSSASAGNLLAKIVDGQAEPLLERHARLPRQVPSRARIVERNPVDVALSARPVLGFELVVGQDRELPIELVDADVNTSAHVVGSASTVFERRQVCGCHVADVHHVAGLFTVAIDCDGLAREHPARKDRDDSSLLAHEILSRPVDVRVAQDGELETKGSVERAEILLEAELAGP